MKHTFKYNINDNEDSKMGVRELPNKRKDTLKMIKIEDYATRLTNETEKLIDLQSKEMKEQSDNCEAEIWSIIHEIQSMNYMITPELDMQIRCSLAVLKYKNNLEAARAEYLFNTGSTTKEAYIDELWLNLARCMINRQNGGGISHDAQSIMAVMFELKCDSLGLSDEDANKLYNDCVCKYAGDD